MRWIHLPDAQALATVSAYTLVAAIHARPEAVLGLPTGSTPLGMYAALRQHFAAGNVDFSRVTTFNLDEYVGVPPEHASSYRTYMHEQLFDHVNIAPQAVHIPNGCARDLAQECTAYEARIAAQGGMDIQVLGIGHNGHIGFNEPGTARDSVTRVVALADSTRAANAIHFPDAQEMPKEALSMGIATILRARKIILLAEQSAKYEALERLAQGERGPQFPAGFLLDHPDVSVLYY